MKHLVNYQREVDKGKFTALASFEKVGVSSVSPLSELYTQYINTHTQPIVLHLATTN